MSCGPGATAAPPISWPSRLEAATRGRSTLRVFFQVHDARSLEVLAEKLFVKQITGIPWRSLKDQRLDEIGLRSMLSSPLDLRHFLMDLGASARAPHPMQNVQPTSDTKREVPALCSRAAGAEARFRGGVNALSRSVRKSSHILFDICPPESSFVPGRGPYLTLLASTKLMSMTDPYATSVLRDVSSPLHDRLLSAVFH